jgi:transposase
MNGKDLGSFGRFLGIDLHKHYLVVGGVDGKQELVLPPRRVNLESWPKWAEANLKSSDAVVLEATTNAWEIYDRVVSLVGGGSGGQPGAGETCLAADRWIGSGRVKTDRVDVLRLASLVAAGLVPEVWVPPLEVREPRLAQRDRLRSLLSHRSRMVKMRTMIRNRLCSVIHRHNLTPPQGEIFSHERRGWWLDLGISPTERLRVRQDLGMMDHLEPLIAEIDRELKRLSTCAPWADQVPYLLQPGWRQTGCRASG